jgi:glycosyltransferase involved in cell wall biosynthesis
VTKPLKILVLSHSSELGGAERSMLDVFDYWVGQNLVEPYFIIRKPLKNMVPELKKRGWKYKTMYYTNWSQRTPSKRAEDVFRNATFNTKAIFQIEKIIKDIQPDAVMTNTIVSPWAAIAAHFQSVPHIWFVREYGDIDHQHIFELGREKMLQDIDTLSDLIVTNSETLAAHVAQYIPKEKIMPLYTPFDLDLLDRKRQQEVKNPFKRKDSLKLVITGRIAPSKGQDEAAEAIGRLVAEGHDLELCVIGLPSAEADAQTLKDVIAKYNIEDRVHLVGHQSNPLAILDKAHVGIMASKQEAFGRVTFEYMATGRPVVGANSGATPEMIDDGKNGYLYKRGNVNDLANKLKHYAKDHTLIEKHGQAARQKTQAMMNSKYNAQNVFEVISKAVENSDIASRRALNFAHRWLEYPSIAQQYIEDSKAISIKRIAYLRVRHKLKLIYLRVTSLRGKDNGEQGWQK